VKCKIRCINFRRVSDPRRAFLLAFRVTGSADDKPGSTWEHVGVPVTNLGAPATSLGAPQITIEQSGETIMFLGNADCAPGNHNYYLSFNDCILIYVSMYLCLHIATHLHTVNLDWLQAVLESNSRRA
jgi:hypothetical protein